MGTEAEDMEEPSLLACFPQLAQSVFFYNTRPPARTQWAGHLHINYYPRKCCMCMPPDQSDVGSLVEIPSSQVTPACVKPAHPPSWHWKLQLYVTVSAFYKGWQSKFRSLHLATSTLFTESFPQLPGLSLYNINKTSILKV